jgi:hypothetical protein
MDAVEAIYSAWSTHITTDTNSGGLSHSTGSQYVAGGVFRAGDPQKTKNLARIELAILPTEVDTDSTRGVSALVRVKIVTKRDLGFTPVNAIEERFHTRFLLGSLSATGWNVSQPVLVRPCFQVGAEGADELAHVAEYTQHITK